MLHVPMVAKTAVDAKTCQGYSSFMTKTLRSLIEHCLEGLYERDQALRLGILAALAGESLFLLGPPGVGKSLIARRLKYILQDGKSFEYLMGRFSTPDEIFGPVSIQKLSNEDLYERRSAGYLPEADIVFLDELWNASPPIQNALLSAMNERIFRNGKQEIHIPMTLLIGASNSLHPGVETEAFWDRFLIRLKVEPIKDRKRFLDFISSETDVYADPLPHALKLTREDLQVFQDHIRKVDLGGIVLEALGELRARMAELGPVSDRRWKKIARLIRASALAHARTEASLADLYVAEHCLWQKPEDLEKVMVLLDEAGESGLSQVLKEGNLLLGEIAAYLDSITALLEKEAGEVIDTPVLVDGEYYRIQPEGRSGEEFRIWKPDGDRVLEGEKQVELFAYQKGKLRSTLNATVGPGQARSRKKGGFALSIVTGDGEKIAAQLITTSQRCIPQDWEGRARLLAGLPDKLGQEKRQALSVYQPRLAELALLMDKLDEELRRDAEEHLFVEQQRFVKLRGMLEGLMKDTLEAIEILGELRAAQNQEENAGNP